MERTDGLDDVHPPPIEPDDDRLLN